MGKANPPASPPLSAAERARIAVDELLGERDATKVQEDDLVARLEKMQGKPVVVAPRIMMERKTQQPPSDREPGKRGPKPGTTREKNEHGILWFVDQVTWNNQNDMTNGQIAAAVLKAGYRTSSNTDDFLNTVYVTGVGILLRSGALKPVGPRGATKYHRDDRKKRVQIVAK